MLRPALLLAALATFANASPALPHAASAARADPSTSALDPYEGYAFLYFRNNNESLYLAVSNGNDILSFAEVNDGKPILSSTKGDKGVRDPYLIRSKEGDKFFIIATDLCVGCGTDWGTAGRYGSRYLEIWETSDLVNFSEQRHTLVSPASYGMSWAPEAYYDAELGTYVVYWASAIYDDATNPDRERGEYLRMVYATTDDFVTFSEPTVWQDYPDSYALDVSVTRAEDGTYHRFTKTLRDGCADIVQESSPSLTAKQDDWTFVTGCIGRSRGTDDLEGPVILKSNPGDVNGERWVLLGDMIIDSAQNRGYVPFETADLASGNWTLGDVNSYPFHPRHGAVTSLTAAELEGIKAAYGGQ